MVEFKTLNIKQLQKIYRLRDVFFKKHHDFSLTRSQKRVSNVIIKKVLNNEGGSVYVEFSRQQGKTAIISLTCEFLMLFYFQIAEKFSLPHTKFFNIGIFAPQKEQAKTDFDKIKMFLEHVKDKGYDFKFNEFNGNTVTFKSENYPERKIFCFSASPTSKTESKTLNLIILEEAQGLLDEKVDNTISPMGAHTNAVKIFIGTAGYKKCRYHTGITTSNPEDCIISDYITAIKERYELFKETEDPIFLNYEKHIKERIDKLGKDSDAFRTQYALEWVLERGQFITYQQLLDIINPNKDFELEGHWGRGETLFVGIDWGKSHDSTVVTIIRGNGEIVDWLELKGDEYNTQYEKIKNFLVPKYAQAIKKIYCDSTGNQDMGVDQLRSMFSPYEIPVIGVKFTAQSKDEMYKNLYSLMVPKTIDGRIIEESIIVIPKKDSVEKGRFIIQFSDLQKEYKNNMWSCNHPEGTGYHDDYCDSLGLACIGIKRLAKKRKVKFFIR